MTQQQKNMTDRARHSVERAAYVAVGAPTAVLKALSARVSELRDTVRSSRRELSDDLAREIDEWVAEGEEVIEGALERLRRSEIADDIRSSARSTRKAARVGIDKASGAARSELGMVPDEELTAIKGIGPGNAGKLGKAGIVGISRFLERTRTRESVENLAASTGIPADTIASWRSQVELGRVEGVGDAYQELLHRTGVWTLDQLADVSPTELSEEMRFLPDEPDQMPRVTAIRQWKAEAKRLSSG